MAHGWSSFPGTPRRVWGALALLIFAGFVLPPAAWCAKFITTPWGERVELETVIHSAFPSGALVVRFQEYRDSSGKWFIHGVRTKSFKNGVKTNLTTFAHGIKDGRFVKWYLNQHVEVEGYYKRGKLHGPITWYYASGKTRAAEQFVDGELHGPYVLYDENGGKKEEGAFRKGLKEGRFTEYHPNGVVAATGTYRAGYLTGRLTYFDQRGRKVAEGDLALDLVTGSWICFAAGGRSGRVREDCRNKVYVECACE